MQVGRATLPAPIIVTALFGDADHHALTALRHAHFPTERNHLPAHLTLFHHLPPSAEAEVTALLKRVTRNAAPIAWLNRLISLGRGVAFLVDSPALSDIRDELASAFRGLLTPQDQASWRPHVTVQNKVLPAEARALLAMLEEGFEPRPLIIAGLAAWWYRGGPWEPIAAYRFGQGHPMKLPAMPARQV